MSILIKKLYSSSKGNLYYLTDGETPLILECGVSIKKIKAALDYKLSDICGCLVSHEHADHSKAVKDIMKSGIDCYMSNGTAEALKLNSHRLTVLKPLKTVQIGSWQVLPFDTVHDCAEPFGFLLKSGKHKVLFFTDTAYCKYRFKGITHMIIECNHQTEFLADHKQKSRIMQSHMSLENTIDFLKSNDLSKLKEIHLIHMSYENIDPKTASDEVKKKTGCLVL